MTDLADLERHARFTVDENGEPVIQIPVNIWNEWKHEQPTSDELPLDYETVARTHPNPQVRDLFALFARWKDEPEDPNEPSWDEIRQSMDENPIRFHLPEEISGLMDDETKPDDRNLP